jgi:hypothetical protein
MWQDGLALLIVGIAVLALVRLYLPSRLLGFGARRGGDSSAASSTAPTGCSGCGLGASCAKATIKTHPIVVHTETKAKS